MVGNDFYYYPLKDNRPYTVYKTIELPNGEVWVCTDYGVLKVNQNEKIIDLPQNVLVDLVDQYVYDAILADDGNLYFASELGLHQIDTAFKSHVYYGPLSENKLLIDEIRTLHQDEFGNIWCGSRDKGLAIINVETKNIEYYKNNEYNTFSISDNAIIDIFQDKSGAVWLGHYGGGIDHYDKIQNQFKRYSYQHNLKDGLNSKRVFAFYEDNQQNLYIGTDGGGVNILKNGKYNNDSIGGFTYIKNIPSDANSLPSNFVWAITGDENDNIWFGTVGGGLSFYQPKENKFTNYQHNEYTNSLVDNSIFSLLLEDSILWIGTDRGISKLSINTGWFSNYIPFKDDIRSFNTNTILDITRDSNGRLWLATFGGGLLLFDDIEGLFSKIYSHDVDNPKSLSYDKVMCVEEDSDNRIWIGTFGGGVNLFDVENESFSYFTEADGLPNDAIYGIIEEKPGVYWLSTNNGLSMLSLADTTFKNFDYSYNLQSHEFNQGAYYKGRNNVFYFGGIDGFNSFMPHKLIKNEYVPPIDIVSFSSPNKQINPQVEDGMPTIKLSYRENNVFFKFVAFNYINSENNLYRYKLEGWNNNWIEIGNKREASFTNLNPGDYIFKVAAANNNGVWNHKGASLRIIVESPVYLKWWFTPLVFLLSFLTLGAIAFLAIKNTRSKAKRQLIESELRVSNAEKLSVQHQLSSLRAQMDPHFIFNSLNSIQHFITEKDAKSARQYLTKFSSLMRRILNNSRSGYISLEDELDTLSLYIELERLRFDNRFSYLLNVDDDVDIEDIEIPSMLFQPYVENAIIHGLKNKSGDDGLLTVSISKVDEQLHVKIEDNGVGRKRAMEIKAEKEKKYNSLGMSVTQDRLKLIGSNETRPKVVIEDLFNSDGGSMGTRVEITVPINLENI